MINAFVLAGAGLLLLAILASAVSFRAGMPLLLVFLLVGLLAGEDGPGGIVFNDAKIAYTVGSVALAVILLDGGLNTRRESFRAGLRPAFTLATLGVVLTCLLTGLLAAWVLDIGLLPGLLIGAVVSSTDAAAVFALLHAKGLKIKQRVSATLEIESGSNDPMAVFLTIACLELIAAGQSVPGLETLSLFVTQMGLGVLAGIGGGRLLVWLVNRLHLEPGMYPMLILSGGLALYAATTVVGGSGFLAIYLAGVVIGNSPLRVARDIRQVHNGLAWFSQICMFLMLGLLATPSSLVDHALPALAIALGLMFLIRPLAVWLCLLPFRFPPREQVYIAWVGLRGAVPIILALFPILVGLPEARLVLDVAFFVVLVSLTVQGWTVAPLARRLGLEVPPERTADEHLELAAPTEIRMSLLGYQMRSATPVLGQAAASLQFPLGVRIATILRGREAFGPVEAGLLREGDLVYLLAGVEQIDHVSAMFMPEAAKAHLESRVFFGDFMLLGDARVESVADLYGVAFPEAAAGKSLAEYLGEAVGNRPVVGDRVRAGEIEFVIREVVDGRIGRVGLKLASEAGGSAGLGGGAKNRKGMS